LADFRNTNQYLSAQNKIGRDDRNQISSAVSITQPTVLAKEQLVVVAFVRRRARLKTLG
jgi:hypothetical protein